MYVTSSSKSLSDLSVDLLIVLLDRIHLYLRSAGERNLDPHGGKTHPMLDRHGINMSGENSEKLGQLLMPTSFSFIYI